MGCWLGCADGQAVPFLSRLQLRTCRLDCRTVGDTRDGPPPLSTNNTCAGKAPLPSPCTLFFGCRSEAGDFYFREEWEAMQAEGVLAPPPAGIVTAFSRDQAAKVYVQHRIWERAKEVWAALQAGAWVYVAGSADRMPADVAAALEAVVAEQGGITSTDAAAFLRRLELTGRYQVEAWS